MIIKMFSLHLDNLREYTHIFFVAKISAFVAKSSALSAYTPNVHSTLQELQTDGSHIFYVTFMKL